MIQGHKPPSGYCLFSEALIGYDIFLRSTGKKMFKFDVYNNYRKKGRESELTLIMDRMHPNFIFKQNENFKEKKNDTGNID